MSEPSTGLMPCLEWCGGPEAGCSVSCVRNPDPGDRHHPPPFDPDPELIDHLEGNERAIRRYRKRAEQMRTDGMENARRIVANIPPLTDAQCDAAALDYAQTRLDEIQALHAPYHFPVGDVVCRECSEPDDWDAPDGPYLYPAVHLVKWPCRTVSIGSLAGHDTGDGAR